MAAVRDISIKAKLAYNTFISKFLSVGINFILYNLSKNKNPESRKEVAELMNMTQEEVTLQQKEFESSFPSVPKGGKRKTRKYKKRHVKKSKTRKGKKSRKHKSKTHKRRKHRRGRKSRKH